MDTTTDLLLLLIFLSGLYTCLGLLCGVAEKVQEILARPHQRRRARKASRRRTPRRGLTALPGGTRAPRPARRAMREKTA
jgi:hypothetical protein